MFKRGHWSEYSSYVFTTGYTAVAVEDMMREGVGAGVLRWRDKGDLGMGLDSVHLLLRLAYPIYLAYPICGHKTKQSVQCVYVCVSICVCALASHVN